MRAKDEMQLHLKQLADKLRHEKVLNKQHAARIHELGSGPTPAHPRNGAQGAADGSGGGGCGGSSHSHTMFRSHQPLGASSVFLSREHAAHLQMQPSHQAPGLAPSSLSVLGGHPAYKPFF
jgi:hypothetical protein